jgi:HAE1 family hydrophobic/amphiphilic exporter-1
VLLEGMALAALVVFAFLRNWRATAITAAAMPLSLIPTFFFMAIMGFSLNVITLLALTLVIGILVDDAIVEIENIQKRIERGQSPWRASVEGADAIGLAVIATTAAIIVVFLPTAFMPGIAGMFFKEFGLTVAVAVLFSLVVARLVTPLMAAYLLKPVKNPKPHKGPPRWYMRTLEWALDHRWIAVAAGGLLFVGSIMLVPLLPTGFQPPENPNFMYVQMQAAPGSTRADMERAVGEATRLFKKRKEVEHVFAHVGGSDPSGFAAGGFTNATLTLALDPHRKLSVSEFKEEMRPTLGSIPDVRTTFLGGWSGAEVMMLLTSENGPALQRAATELNKQMRTVKEVAAVRPTDPPVAPELVIRPKPEEAARLGVTSQTIASVARVASLATPTSTCRSSARASGGLPIRVRLPEDARADLNAIRNLKVPTATGGVTTLESVADITFQAGSSQIKRLDRRRSRGRSRPGGRRGAGSGGRQDQRPADHEEPARGREPGGQRRHRGHDRHDDRADRGAGRRDLPDLRGDGPAVRQLLQADHHPVGPAAVARRRLPGAAGRRHGALPALAHRLPHADGSGGEELDPAGGVRHRAGAGGRRPARGADRSLYGAGAARS